MRKSHLHYGISEQPASHHEPDVTYLRSPCTRVRRLSSESVALDFERDARGRIVAVIYRSDGVERRQKCAAVFVRAGALETPRLPLHCGIANSSGQVRTVETFLSESR